MQSEFLEIAECLMSNVWRMVTTVEYPGLGISIAAILIAVFLVGLGIRVFAYVFGFSVNITGTASSVRRMSKKEEKSK